LRPAKIVALHLHPHHLHLPHLRLPHQHRRPRPHLLKIGNKLPRPTDPKVVPSKTKRRLKISKPVRIAVLLLLHQRSQHREGPPHLQMDNVLDHRVEMLKM
jgi:hypothetical protein